MIASPGCPDLLANPPVMTRSFDAINMGQGAHDTTAGIPTKTGTTHVS